MKRQIFQINTQRTQIHSYLIPPDQKYIVVNSARVTCVFVRTNTIPVMIGHKV